jgi:hypothetical protein
MTPVARHPQYVSTSQFMTWLRAQQTLASGNGYTASDLDCVWRDYRRKLVMLIECKCRMATPGYAQRQMLREMDIALRHGMPLVGWQYRGAHLIQFERESPTDGRIFIDGREVDQAGLVRFLSFDETAL